MIPLLSFLLFLASLTSLQAGTLLLDFGPLPATPESASSPARSAGALPSFPNAWNTIQGDAAALIYGNGQTATNISVAVGRSGAGQNYINFADDGFLSGALGGQLKTGIYADGSPARDAIYGGSGGGNALAVGIRIDGLPAGTYTIYFSGRNTSTLNATPQRFFCTNGPASPQFNFSPAISPVALANSVPPITSAFVVGDNFGFTTLTLVENDSIFLAAIGIDDGVNAEKRGFINTVEVIPGLPPEPSSPLTNPPTVSIQQNHLTMTYGRLKAATNFEFKVARSTNLQHWLAGSDHIDEFTLADDGTNETRVARDKAAVDSQAQSFLRLQIQPAPKTIQGARVVCFGDSITFGQGVPSHANWVNQLKDRFGLNMINAGVSGNTSSQGLARLQNDVLAAKPDFVIINFGMNDHVMTALDLPKISLATFRSNLTEMIDRVRGINAIPILVTVNYLIEGDATRYYYNRHPESFYANVGGAEAWLDAYVQVVRDLAAEKSVDLVDIHEACANYNKFEFLRSLENAAQTDDGVHPYVIGSNVYAQMIGDFLAAHY